MEQENNPKLVIQKNQPITIRLKSTEPFHESEHPQWGKSYGYNVCVKNVVPVAASEFTFTVILDKLGRKSY